MDAREAMNGCAGETSCPVVSMIVRIALSAVRRVTCLSIAIGIDVGKWLCHSLTLCRYIHLCPMDRSG